MNRYIILMLLAGFTHAITGQTKEKKNTVLQGKINDIVTHSVFPLTDDSTLKKNTYPVIYPLLIVNDVPIRDKKR